MNKKILFTTTLVLFMLLSLPTTTAHQTTIETHPLTQLPTYHDLQHMNLNDLITLTLELTQDNPTLTQHLSQQLSTIDIDTIINQTPEDLTDNNETIIQKMFNRILNYRFFRLYLSFFITLYTQSTISLTRTLHWAIKTLKWLQFGLIFGIIDLPDYTPPETPTIIFTQNNENNTLTVTTIQSNTTFWTDIEQIGAGTTDPLPTGTITEGDKITNCTGIIILRYKPTNDLIGIYEFT